MCYNTGIAPSKDIKVGILQLVCYNPFLHKVFGMADRNGRYLLLTSSITMGGIGIWCMHFIGNRAIVLGHGAKDIQILYNVAFTGTSFVLPVIVLLAAFYSVGVEEKAGYLRILIGGLLTGSAVCGMHYVGQLGIANYKCSMPSPTWLDLLSLLYSPAPWLWVSSSDGGRLGRIAGGDEGSVLVSFRLLCRACTGRRRWALRIESVMSRFSMALNYLAAKSLLSAPYW